MAIGSASGSAIGSATLLPGTPGAPGGPGGGPPPTPGTGWEVRVLSAVDYSTMLAWVPQRLWNSLTWSDMLNSQAQGTQGSGTIVLNMDDTWWNTVTMADSTGTHPAHYILDLEHLWQVWQNGVLRFEWLGETITETLVQEGEGRLVTVTGPDTSQVLNWADAMPNGFPNEIVYKTDALQDSFDEVNITGQYVLDTGLWNASSGTGNSINPAGSAQLAATSGGTVLGSTSWDATNSLFSAQVSPIVSPDAFNNTLNGSQLTQMYLEDTSGSGYYVLMALSGNTFYAQYNGPDGTFTSAIDTATGYNTVQGATGNYYYWQISNAGGFFYFWTSPDGQVWTQQWSHAANWSATSVGVYFSAQYTGSNAEYATITSINSNVVTSSLGGPTYLDQPIMSIWLQTLEDAQDRGTVPWVTTAASATADSFGNQWTDSISVQVQNGTSLYQLLQGQAAMVNADWKMFPGMRLVIGLPSATSPNEGAVTLGFDRSPYVRFYEAGGETNKTRQRARNAIVNLVAAINADGRTVTAQNATSIASWSQREAWVQAAAQVSEADIVVVADAAAEDNANEVLAWTLQITPNVAARTVYQDFQVGDWVGLERPDFSATDAVRVVGITVSVDSDGNEVHELTLFSYIQWLQQQLLFIQNKLGGAFVNAPGTTLVPDNAQSSTLQSPTVFNETFGALGTSGANGNPMVYNAATGQWVPAGSTDPVSGETVNLAVTGQGQATVVTSGGLTVGTTGSNPGPLNSNYDFPGGASTGWTATTATLAVVAAASTPAGNAPAAYAGKLTPTSNGAGVLLSTTGAPAISGIVAGNTYTVTAYVYMATQTDMTITVKAAWYNSKNQLLSTSTGSAGAINASAWQQVSYSVTAPAGATGVTISIGPTTAVTTNAVYITDFYIYNASFASGIPNSSGAGGSTATTVGATGTTVTDGTGTVRAITGLQADGTITFQGYNSPAPLAPDAPTVTATLLGINVAWDGLLGGAAPLLDFEQVQVHMSTSSGFVPSAATLQGTLQTAGNMTITQLTAGTTYYFVLLAENDAGTLSPLSTQESASPQTVTQNIPNNSISSSQLNFSAGGVNITFSGTAPSSPHTGDLWYNTSSGNELSVWSGSAWTPEQFGTNAIVAASITGNLIAANTIAAGNIISGTITALQIASNTITATQLAVGSTTGQNLYFAGGVTTGWVGFGGTLTALASGLPTGAPYSSGAKLSTDGSTSGPAIRGSSSAFGVVVSQYYMGTAWVYSAQTSIILGITWLNSSGGVISSSATTSTVTASTWSQISVLGQAPSGAVTAYIYTGLPSTPANGTLLYATEIRVYNPINGGIIEAATIETAQIAAGAITTGTIAANAITTGTIAANAVTSAQIAAGTIQASDLAVGGVYNQNAYFAAGDTTGCTATSGSVSGTTSPPSGAPYAAAAELTCNGSAGPFINCPQFAVQSGVYYMAQAWVYSANTSATIGFQWFDKNKVSLSSAIVTVTIPASTWTQITAVELAPPGSSGSNPAMFGQLQVGLSGTPSNGTILYVQEALVFPPIQGGVIEAGTITAQQLAVGAVVAGTVAAGAIDGMTLTGNVINAAQIVGDTIVLQGANDGVYCYAGAATQIVKSFTSAGTTTWVAPSNVSSADVYCIGGGGGGSNYNSGGYGGGGGGGAGCGYTTGRSVTAGSTYYINVGAGGSGNSNGTDSWFNSSNTESGATPVGNGGIGSSNQWGASGGSFTGGTGGFSGGTGGNSSPQSGAGGGGAGSAGGGSAGSNGNECVGRTGGTPGAGGSSANGIGLTAGAHGGRGSDAGNNSGGGPGIIPGGAGGGSSAGGTGGSGAQGIVVLAYAPSSGQLTAYLTGASGVDPVNGSNVIAGVGAENLLLYGENTPSSASIPTGAAILYTTTNGTPSYMNPNGQFGTLAATRANIQTNTSTGTGYANITGAWPIQANDPQVGTLYRLTVWGEGNPGTSASSQALGFEINAFGANNVATGVATMGFIGNNAFYFRAEAVIMINTIGSSGTATMNLNGVVALAGRDQAVNFSTSTYQVNPFVGGTGSPVGINTTASTTFSIQCAWISTSGSPTISGVGSVLERLGA